jgi:hypothetical protein
MAAGVRCDMPILLVDGQQIAANHQQSQASMQQKKTPRRQDEIRGWTTTYVNYLFALIKPWQYCLFNINNLFIII